MSMGDRRRLVRSHDFLSGLFWVILSIGTCLAAYRVKVGDIHNPGFVFNPSGVAALLGLMSIGLWIKSPFQVMNESNGT